MPAESAAQKLGGESRDSRALDYPLNRASACQPPLCRASVATEMPQQDALPAVNIAHSRRARHVGQPDDGNADRVPGPRRRPRRARPCDGIARLNGGAADRAGARQVPGPRPRAGLHARLRSRRCRPRACPRQGRRSAVYPLVAQRRGKARLAAEWSGHPCVARRAGSLGPGRPGLRRCHPGRGLPLPAPRAGAGPRRQSVLDQDADRQSWLSRQRDHRVSQEWRHAGEARGNGEPCRHARDAAFCGRRDKSTLVARIRLCAGTNEIIFSVQATSHADPPRLRW